MIQASGACGIKLFTAVIYTLNNKLVRLCSAIVLYLLPTPPRPLRDFDMSVGPSLASEY
jgi:hypothetical protein